MLTTVVPKLPFIDKEKTITFYRDYLGFTILSDYGDYFISKCDSIEIHFFSFPKLKPRKSDFMIYIRVDKEIDSLYNHYQEKGVAIHPNAPIANKPWKQREFAILDPNGTLLTFGQSIV